MTSAVPVTKKAQKPPLLTLLPRLACVGGGTAARLVVVVVVLPVLNPPPPPVDVVVSVSVSGKFGPTVSIGGTAENVGTGLGVLFPPPGPSVGIDVIGGTFPTLVGNRPPVAEQKPGELASQVEPNPGQHAETPLQ